MRRSARLHPAQGAVGDIKAAILGHAEFTAFNQSVTALFVKWKKANIPHLEGIAVGGQPKALIETLSEDLLETFRQARLLDPYDMYQHLLDYWAETMQDDCYLIAADGWKADTYRVIEKDKKGKKKDKGWTCDLVPKALIIARYFAEEQEAVTKLGIELESEAA
jgi:type I restriction enzyme M protein